MSVERPMISSDEKDNDQDLRSSSTPGEHHYDAYSEYLLSLIGLSVGLGSFWRFPYLVYRNGGGAFLIPYLTSMVLIGMPLLYLETAVGQIFQSSIPKALEKVHKGLKMLGISFVLISFHFSGFYNVILTYTFRFLFSAFEDPLPFANQSPQDSSYFSDTVLHKSSGIQEFGEIQKPLFFTYAFCLLISYLIIKNGVKTSGKIMTVTALLPYFFFIILAIRGFFLQGAMEGLKFLLIPDFPKIFSPKIWLDAIVQVFYQVTLACGAIFNLSSMKPKKQKFLIGVYLIPISLVTCGMLCALNIFMYLGHFCLQSGVSIDSLQLVGPELSFNIFPKALAILPWPNLWVLVFFIAMIFLGIDTESGYLECIFCYLKDQVGQDGKINLFITKVSLSSVKFVTICSIMVFSPLLTCSAGIYYMGFFDDFVPTIPLSLCAVIEYVVFVKIIPFSQIQEETLRLTGEKAPKWIEMLLEGKIVIVILLINLLLAIVNQIFFFFKYSLMYYVLGSLLTIYPFIMAYFYYRRNMDDKIRVTMRQIQKVKEKQKIQLSEI